MSFHSIMCVDDASSFESYQPQVILFFFHFNFTMSSRIISIEVKLNFSLNFFVVLLLIAPANAACIKQLNSVKEFTGN